MRRLLIIGCGDVARRALPWLARRFKLYALCRTPEAAASLRALGVHVLIGDLDQPTSLRRLAGLAPWVLHCAPPSTHDKALLATLARGGILARGLCYISTSGVYGDCEGALISETQPVHPQSMRASKRVEAEAQLRQFARTRQLRLSILRSPGIYAQDRLPLARVQAATPVIDAKEDSFSNHIHADDLAMAACLALFRGRGGRVYHVCDDAHWKMGDWFDKVADAYALPHPPRLPKAQIKAQVSPALWSFMRESRRLSNERLKNELRLRLAYPTPDHLLEKLRFDRT